MDNDDDKYLATTISCISKASKHYKTHRPDFAQADVRLKPPANTIKAHLLICVSQHLRKEVCQEVVDGVHDNKRTPKLRS